MIALQPRYSDSARLVLPIHVLCGKMNVVRPTSNPLSHSIDPEV